MLEDSRKEKKWYGTHLHKPGGEWDKSAEGMMFNFAESGHPVFPATSAWERGESRSEGRGKKSIHFNGSDETVELILRNVISVNQLSIYGAVADLCKESTRDSLSARKSAENENWSQWWYRPNFFMPVQSVRVTCLYRKPVAKIRAEIRRTSRTTEIDQTLLQTLFFFLSKNIDKRKFFTTLDEIGP